ncbi:LysM peptidoglycan-binding domain-containing protein [Flavobacterium salilacus subsp. salilacus]|uniref:LysM peptidoglycan-binding domain-containing protein n=2 Tax=Flavobacterium TaxID=237 RepID=UPI0010758AD2|nr:LysM peptidoglycan-binding domain-containing protein [Flavobacterium salilacus]KAF2519717.1 LysM peptidoglycan-binding domain-containing protein [Flavobacterium salilacus subsp. salilacus]MBE1614394.1 LysM peptidoglycan-binding domain-containing protein [Flavobacterium sp. SaA2.13]
MLNKLLSIFFCTISLTACAQVDTTEVVIDSISADTTEIVTLTNIISNSTAMKAFFEKLQMLEEQKSGKINIVHIGDSHIQADLFSGTIRENLQTRFGNGGLGFSFPHSMAKTNGSRYVRYTSNASWESRRNIYPENGIPIGLSGIGLTTQKDFVIEVSLRDTAYAFNTLKIITPVNISCFDAATSSKTIILESDAPKVINHKIKSGEVLGTIARKYHVTVAQLKKANGLRSDNIRAGKTLKIPTGEMEQRKVKRSEFIPLPLENDGTAYSYHSDAPLSKIYLLPNASSEIYSLNGLVLEKDAPGVLYHNIGVNGAKASDYNKYPLFFEQLPALNPDLIIISLGTNESFDKIEVADYIIQLNTFINNIRAKNPEVCLLVMTPPPSLFKRKYPNTFVAAYAKNIVLQEADENYASWDMFSELGGLYGVNKNAAKGLMSSDKVHYSVQGYQKQGMLFTEAFMNAYNNFKNNGE